MPTTTATRPPERRRALRVGLVTLAVAMFGTSALYSLSSAYPAPERLVYVSGRDDHGLLADESVAVFGQPDGAESGRMPDGTLARVADQRDRWHRVVPVDGSPGGWIDDHYLRGRVHLVDPEDPGCAVSTAAEAGGRPRFQLPASQQVELLDAEHSDGELWVAVRADAGHELSWVPATTVFEITGPDPRGAADLACDAVAWPEPVHDH